MIPILNALNVNIAVFGNHDFGKFINSFLVKAVCPQLILIITCLHNFYKTSFTSKTCFVSIQGQIISKATISKYFTVFSLE